MSSSRELSASFRLFSTWSIDSCSRRSRPALWILGERGLLVILFARVSAELGIGELSFVLILLPTFGSLYWSDFLRVSTFKFKLEFPPGLFSFWTLAG